MQRAIRLIHRGMGRIHRRLSAEPAQYIRYLVIGAGRGGTSVLAALLDAHPKLVMGFEYRARFLQGIDVPIEDRSHLAHRRIEMFRDACIDEALNHPGKFWGNKITTERIAQLNDHNLENPGQPVDVMAMFFDQFFAMSKVIFIVRDGRTCVRSKMNRTDKTLDEACHWWRYSVAMVRYLRAGNAPYLEIRYEDLVSNPERELRRVCDFLQVDYQAEMLTGTDSNKLISDYRQSGISTSGLQLDDIPEGCIERINADLEFLGYH